MGTHCSFFKKKKRNTESHSFPYSTTKLFQWTNFNTFIFNRNSLLVKRLLRPLKENPNHKNKQESELEISPSSILIKNRTMKITAKQANLVHHLFLQIKFY